MKKSADRLFQHSQWRIANVIKTQCGSKREPRQWACGAVVARLLCMTLFSPPDGYGEKSVNGKRSFLLGFKKAGGRGFEGPFFSLQVGTLEKASTENGKTVAKIPPSPLLSLLAKSEVPAHVHLPEEARA